MKNDSNKNILVKQISIILIIILYTIVFDFSFYNLITKNYINHYSKIVKEKSIDIKSYLPFDDDSLIVKKTANEKIINGDIPKIDGATALYPIYSAFVNALYTKDCLSYDYENNEFLDDSKIDKTGTETAFQNVIDGKVDIIFCATPSKKQKRYAESKNVELELVPIGKEAFVFIVNKNNPVSSLTVDQVRDIYSGKISNWKEVGGENKPIINLLRNEGSGSQTAMQIFMNGIPIKKSKQVFYGRRIAYSFRYYVESIVRDGNIKMLSLNGVEPTIDNIRNGKYPMFDNFYMIYRKDNLNPNIKVFRDYVLSKDGQDIIDETGYVSINNFNG